MGFTSGIVPNQLPAAVVGTGVFIVPDAVTFLWKGSKAGQSAAAPHTGELRCIFTQWTIHPGLRRVPSIPEKKIFFKLVLVSFAHHKEFVGVKRVEAGDTVSKVFFALCELKSFVSVEVFKNREASTQTANFLHLKKSTRKRHHALGLKSQSQSSHTFPQRLPSASRQTAHRRTSPQPPPCFCCMRCPSQHRPPGTRGKVTE